MRSARLLVALSLSLSGCARDYLVGDADNMDGGGSGSGSGFGTMAQGEDDVGDTGDTGNADGAEGSGSTGGNATDTADTDNTNNSDGVDTDNNGNADASVTAVYLPGGLDRIRIFHRVPAEGYCTAITIVTPAGDGGNDNGTLMLPPDWGYEGAEASTDLVDCTGAADGTVSLATAATGEISFADDNTPDGIPCTLDIDVQLQFGNDASVVANDDVVADTVPVMGCP